MSVYFNTTIVPFPVGRLGTPSNRGASHIHMRVWVDDVSALPVRDTLIGVEATSAGSTFPYVYRGA